MLHSDSQMTDSLNLFLWLILFGSWFKAGDMSIGKGELDSIQNKMIRRIYESPGKQYANLMRSILSLTGDPAFSTDWQTHRVHRVAMANFWRTFHHDGKINPGWWGCGCMRIAQPFHYIYHLVPSRLFGPKWHYRLRSLPFQGPKKYRFPGPPNPIPLATCLAV